MKYGLMGQLMAQSGQGENLGQILQKAADLLTEAPGCYLYIVNQSSENPDVIAVFEVWESKEAHDRSLEYPGVRELIQQAMPLLAEMPQKGTEYSVLGGLGLER